MVKGKKSKGQVRWILLGGIFMATLRAAASDSDWWSLHGQLTVIPQGHGYFHSLYSGANSLSATPDTQMTTTATFFAGLRLWQRGEVFVNPELDGGAGLSTGLGVAGFPNGEGTRVATRRIKPYLSRVFIRQRWGWGGAGDAQVSDANDIAGPRSTHQVVWTFGKLAATDLFDQNRYSHDPRTQFLNWSLMDNAAWDYPANSRGYSWGSAMEILFPRAAVRAGGFLMPRVANGPDLDPSIAHAHGLVMELEQETPWRAHPGKIRLMGFFNQADMGDYRTTLDTPAFDEDITRSRQVGATKYGYGLNLEQELAEGLGSFARLGWNDGHTETWAFTEVDRTATAGLLLEGSRWKRPKDQVGLACAVNGLSTDHRDYLAAGGNGFMLGDGHLNYGPETILELFYDVPLWKRISLTPDLQGIEHPGYNRDRGPVAVYGLRLHGEF